ncbi:MAG: 30S ribosome-binding factor RbfA [Peptococcaceae bacterium]|nr:30S ribosome-binding factor RbfA [Peptococcaceae bacterium]
MGKYRLGRVAESLKEEISAIVREQLKDPRIGFVTVTGVEVAQDLGHAVAYVSILGDDTAVKESIAALNRAAGFVRSEVGKRVRLFHTPQIVFKHDQSLDHAIRIAKLINEVHDNTSKPEGQA